MLLEQLREIVWKCNLELPKNDLVKMTSGNVSGRDRETGLVVIKPSGFSYEEMKPEHMVVVDLNGRVIEGDHKPSVDTDTHLYVYQRRPDVFGMAHTHSPYATSFAVLGQPIPACLTTCALLGGEVPLGGYAPIGGDRDRSGNYRQYWSSAGYRHAESRCLHDWLIASAGDKDGCRSRGDRENHAPGDAAWTADHAFSFTGR